MQMQRSDKQMWMWGGLAVAGVTALVAAGAWLFRRGQQRPAPTIEDDLHIACPPEVAMAVFADGERLADAMEHADAERYADEVRVVHWEQQGPMGLWVNWDARVRLDPEKRCLVWHTTDDSPMQAHGTIEFRPVQGGNATELHFESEYEPPMGLKAIWPAMLERMVQQKVSEDLHRVQEQLEVPEQHWN